MCVYFNFLFIAAQKEMEEFVRKKQADISMEKSEKPDKQRKSKTGSSGKETFSNTVPDAYS